MKKILVIVLVLVLSWSSASCKSRINTGAGSPVIPSASQNTPAAALSTSAAAVYSAASPAPSTSPVPTAPDDLIRLEGTIGDIPVHMSLKIKDGKVNGSYYYDKIKQDIRLDGTTEANRMIAMKEYSADGAVTGTFDGWYVPGFRIAGSWINAKTKTVLKYSMRIIDGIPKDAVWSGEWKRINAGRFSSANLVIFKETKTSFDFQMDAYSGANMGFLNGSASFSGNLAKYKDSSTGAELTFILKDGLIYVTANKEANGQAGAGVGFDGTYTKGDLPAETLLSLGFMPNKSQDDVFHAMTAEDYELFLDTAHIGSETQDLDGFGAHVFRWFVKGIATTNTSIVMFLPDGKICAAVIDPKSTLIKVYTNADYINAVPKTIQAWIDGFVKMPVEFHATIKN